LKKKNVGNVKTIEYKVKFMHGENAEKKINGTEYWAKRGLNKSLNWFYYVGEHNKLVKRLLHKKERKEVKTYIHNKDFDKF
jgi:hypothetical protein